MSLNESGDGIRVITPVTFFPSGSMQAAPMNEVTKVEESDGPKGSSVPASAISSSEPVVQEPMEPVSPSPESLVPPAPPTPSETADKDSGKPKENGNSTPAG